MAGQRTIFWIPKVIERYFRLLYCCFRYVYCCFDFCFVDFIAKEKEQLIAKNDETIEIETDTPPLLSDSNISVITLDSTINESKNNSSLSDTLSLDSSTSAQFDSLLVIGSDENINELGVSKGNNIGYHFL